jgi:hypothetical protein
MSLLLPPQGSELRGLFDPMDLLDPAKLPTADTACQRTGAMRHADPAVQSVNWLAIRRGHVVLLATDGDTVQELWSFGTTADAGIIPPANVQHLRAVFSQ